MGRTRIAGASALIAAIAGVYGLASAQPTSRSGAASAPTIGAIYPSDATHSPITSAVRERLRALVGVGSLRPNVFAKIGASATVNRNFMRCFAGPNVDLADHAELSTTWRYFNDDQRAAPYLRRSGAAAEGWHVGRAVWGSPSPAVREVRDLDARFAVVMYGTNDIELGRPHRYAQLMLRLTRTLTVRGVIPILSTIMPRDDDVDADRMVSLYNAVVRGVAQSEQVPMVDLHRELSRLPDHGLSRDGIHPNVYFRDGDPHGCNFSARGLQHGYNVRNLLTLTALDRLRRHVLEPEAAPDEPAPPPRGAGSPSNPIAVPGLPFAHASDTASSPHRTLDRYRCGDQDESGPEVVYRLVLEEAASIYAMVVYESGVDVDLHLLSGGRCVARGNEHLTSTLGPGVHDFVVDTFVNTAGEAQSGRYLFVVGRTDRPSDPD